MPSSLFAVAQMTTTGDREANLASATSLVREAAGLGAEMIFLPEMWPFIGSDADKVAGAEALDGPSTTRMRELARELGIWLQPGSFAERSPVAGRVYNTAAVIRPDGEIEALYRKVHLFDIDLPGGAVLMESDTVTPGDKATVAATPYGQLGLSICYDLRFPELYRSLRVGGAEIVCVPAAFTAHTGKDHWEVLIRARAIEQQVWICAADQGGHHNSKRASHGHSMIVDPWGLVVARCSDGPGLCLAQVDLERVHTVRAALPVADHRRPFVSP